MKKHKKFRTNSFEKGLLWILSSLGIIVLLAMCTACANIPTKNYQEAEILVFSNGKLVQNQSILLGRKQEISFSFIQGISEGLHPKIYIYGPVYAGYTPSLEPDTTRIKPNVGYILKTRFSRPGEAIVMFIWEGDGAFGESVTVYLKYKE